MADMGVFDMTLEGGGVLLSRSQRAKASPEDSAVWRAMQGWKNGF